MNETGWLLLWLVRSLPWAVFVFVGWRAYHQIVQHLSSDRVRRAQSALKASSGGGGAFLMMWLATTAILMAITG